MIKRPSRRLTTAAENGRNVTTDLELPGTHGRGADVGRWNTNKNRDVPAGAGGPGEEEKEQEREAPTAASSSPRLHKGVGCCVGPARGLQSGVTSSSPRFHKETGAASG